MNTGNKADKTLRLKALQKGDLNNGYEQTLYRVVKDHIKSL